MSDVSNVTIDPTAVVCANAQIGEGTQIGAYAIVEENTVLGKSCKIAAHAIIRSGARLGDGVKVDSFAVIAGPPQDIKFNQSTPSYVEIGYDTTIREGVTIHRATVRDGVTRVGHNCFLMGNSHVAHDCQVGNYVAIANGALLGGHVHIDDWAFLGGGSAYHQYVRVGQSAMIAGNATMTHDVPPFVTAAERNDCHGLNLVGLKRRGFTSQTISQIKDLYKQVLFRKPDPVGKAQKALQHEKNLTAEGKLFLEFFMESKRNFIRSR